MTLKTAQLDFQEHPVLQRVDWAAQRLSALLFGVFLIAALLGVFGGGPLSDTTVRDGDLGVHYERFARRECPAEITIQFDRPLGDTCSIELRGPFFAQSEIESLSPQPEQQMAAPEGVRLIFSVAPDAPLRITMRINTKHSGSLRGSIRAQQGVVPISVMVYP